MLCTRLSHARLLLWLVIDCFLHVRDVLAVRVPLQLQRPWRHHPFLARDGVQSTRLRTQVAHASMQLTLRLVSQLKAQISKASAT